INESCGSFAVLNQCFYPLLIGALPPSMRVSGEDVGVGEAIEKYNILAWNVFLRRVGVRSRKKCASADESSQSIASCGNGWPNWLLFRMKKGATDHGQRGRDSTNQPCRNRESDRADSRNESGAKRQKENRATVKNRPDPGGTAPTEEYVDQKAT